jgi:DNA polymerase eta
MNENHFPRTGPWLTRAPRQGLIAINYPSRKFGLTRHITITEAKKLCPDLILQHVATWKEGDEKWAYHEDAAKNIATHKVSLDPYRLESRRILACIKETLPADIQKVEKASIDEVFMDLSAQVHSIMLERYPELALHPPQDDPTEYLPLPPSTVLDWKSDAVVDLDTEETEYDDPDWDDVAILIGSEIVRTVRAAVFAKLKYTCSGGVSRNKMLAKLGSGHMKPNQQTVIRNRAVQQFLSGFKFTKIRGLGGKLGDQISSAFDTDTVTDLLVVPIEQLKQKLGDETGTWVHQTIRGIDSSEVNARTQIKSMLSAKSFRPSINTAEQAKRWLRIFAADIYSRLVEEGVLENKRRPKTISLHHRTGGHTRSRQASIPKGKKLDETALFELATVLMDQIILEGTVWPCINLSLSVGGFEDGISGNMGIGDFLIKGEDAKAHRSGPQEANSVSRDQERQGKRRRVESPRGIGRFFVKTDHAAHDEEFGAQKWPEPDSGLDTGRDALGGFASPSREADEATEKQDVDNIPSGPSALHQQRITDFVCKRCQLDLPSADALLSHQDWHFAKDLQDEERRQPSHGIGQAAIGGSKKASQHSRHKTGQGKTEKGQSKLAFG